MEVHLFPEPRRFAVGINGIELKHVASFKLLADEVVTFVRDGGHEYEVTAKEWGFYATPSLGSRLRANGMRAALIRNVSSRRLFVVLVSDERTASWRKYMRAEGLEFVVWLDELEGILPHPGPDV